MVWGEKTPGFKLLAVVSGFCQESLPKGMKFGHAGAKEGLKGEGSARAKSEALKKAGAIVPDTFGALGPAIKATHEELLKSGAVKPIPDLGTGRCTTSSQNGGGSQEGWGSARRAVDSVHD